MKFETKENIKFVCGILVCCGLFFGAIVTIAIHQTNIVAKRQEWLKNNCVKFGEIRHDTGSLEKTGYRCKDGIERWE